MTLPVDHLFWSYRLAKFEVVAERRGVGRLSFARFEQDLVGNLHQLQPRASEPEKLFRDINPGAVWVRPKSVDRKNATKDGSSSVFVPEHAHDHQIERMSVRVLLAPTPQFATSEVLWLRAFGPVLDAMLSKGCLGNRLNLHGTPAAIPVGGQRVYRYWAPAYQRFRAGAIEMAQQCLKSGDRRCVLVTLDLATYYDNIAPRFLLDDAFIAAAEETAVEAGVAFDVAAYRAATEGLLEGFSRFRTKISQVVGIKRPHGIPIGSLTARIIANLALVELDRHIQQIPGVRYYGRYVDDILIVQQPGADKVLSAKDAVARFVPLDTTRTTNERLVLDEGALKRPGSFFVIQTSKLRVFNLHNEQGLEYLGAVKAEMQRVSSERRRFLEPSEEKLDQTIMASPNAEPIRALREADALSLRRLAVSTASDKVATAAAMLVRPEAAKFSRKFLGKAGRLATDWSRWADLIDVSLRILGSALLSGDEETANEVISALTTRAASLDDSSTPSFTIRWGNDVLGESARKRLREWVEEQLVEVIASATPFKDARFVLDGLTALKRGVRVGGQVLRARALLNRARLLAAADLRLSDRETDQGMDNPRVPRPAEVLRTLQAELATDGEYLRRAAGIAGFLDACNVLEDKTFAGLLPVEVLLLFRPPTYLDLLFRWLRSERMFVDFIDVVNAIRGTRYKSIPMRFSEADQTVYIEPPTENPFDPAGEVDETKIVLGNLCTDGEWWAASLTKKPALTQERQGRLARVLNLALDAGKRKPPRPTLLVLPELSLPRRWWRQVCAHLARSEPMLSLVAGLEYDVIGSQVYNEAFAYFPRPYFSAAMWVWTKRRPAHHEAPELKERGFTFAKRAEDRRFVRISSEHGQFIPLICSELLEVDTRSRLLDRVDFVLVPAWNQDTTSFEYLVHASALELHSFVAVANNGVYSDCRIRGPFAESWRREVCRLISRGANEVVSAMLPVSRLRQYRKDQASYDKRRSAWQDKAKAIQDKTKEGKAKLTDDEKKYLGECPWPEWKPAPPGDSWPGGETK